MVVAEVVVVVQVPHMIGHSCRAKIPSTSSRPQSCGAARMPQTLGSGMPSHTDGIQVVVDVVVVDETVLVVVVALVVVDVADVVVELTEVVVVDCDVVDVVRGSWYWKSWM